MWYEGFDSLCPSRAKLRQWWCKDNLAPYFEYLLERDLTGGAYIDPSELSDKLDGA